MAGLNSIAALGSCTCWRMLALRIARELRVCQPAVEGGGLTSLTFLNLRSDWLLFEEAQGSLN